MAETKLGPFQIDTVALSTDPDMISGIAPNIEHAELSGVVGTIYDHAAIDTHIDGTALQHPAIDITYDNTGGNFGGTDVQNVLVEAGNAISVRDTSVTGTRISAVGTEGKMTPNATNPTTAIDVAAGKGFIIDSWGEPDHPNVTTLSWALVTNMTILMPEIVGVQTIYVDVAGSVQQKQGLMNESEKRSNTVLGLVYYSNGIIDAIENTPKVVNNSNYSFFDYIDFLSFNDKTNGLLTKPVDNALSVWISGGDLYQIGIEWFNDPKSPNTLVFGPDGDTTTPITFDVVLSDGSTYLQGQTVLPKFYEAGSPPAAVALTGIEATIHYFFQLRGGKYIVQLGATLYADAITARTSLSTDFANYTTFPNSSVTFLSAQVYISFSAVDFSSGDLAGIANIATSAGASGDSSGGGTGGVDEFIDLIDVISTTYSGAAGQMVTVDPTEVGLEFTTPPATVISYDDTNTDLQGPGTPITDVQLAIEKLDTKRRFKNTTRTGIRVGGVMSELTPTTIDITDGDGAIIDAALTPTAASGITVTWTGQSGIVVDQTGTGTGDGATYIFINNVGTVLQFLSKPANSVFVQNIFLGVVYYVGGAITAISNAPAVLDSTALNFSDYVNFHDVNNHHGVVPLAIGSGDPNSILEFYVTSGELFAQGINWHNDVYNPNVVQIAASGTDTTGAIPWNGGATFNYILSDGTITGTGVNVLLHNRYDDGTSTPALVLNGDGQIQFIVKVPGGDIYVQYYTKTYRDGKAALAGVNSALADLVLADQIAAGTIIGAYAGQAGEDSWERGDRNVIVVFGGSGSSSSTSASPEYYIDVETTGATMTNNVIPGGWTTTYNSLGNFTVTHNLGDTTAGFALSVIFNGASRTLNPTAITTNDITFQIADPAGALVEGKMIGKLLF